MSKIKNVSELINCLKVSSGEDILFLLGAGCSISSGCMAAGKLVKEFKRRIFCAEKNIPYNSVNDYSNLDKDILDHFIHDNPENPYSFYFEKCFPNPNDRNMFIKKEFLSKNPSYGYLCFANYLIEKDVKCILTTNFDELCERAIRKLDPNYDFRIVSENQNPILTPKLQIFKLHGDYNYDSIQNTAEELLSLKESTVKKLSNLHMRRIVVLGYSGLDQSIMDFLEQKVIENSDIEVLWCGLEEYCSNDRINRILSFNKESSYVRIESFDSLFIRYYKVYSSKNEIIESIGKKMENEESFDLNVTRIEEELKGNLYCLLNKPKVYRTEFPEDIDIKEYKLFKYKKFLYFVGNKYDLENIENIHKLKFKSVDLLDEEISIDLKKCILSEIILLACKGKKMEIYNNNVFLDCQSDIKTGIQINIILFDNKYYLALSPNYFYIKQNINNNEKYVINMKKSILYTNRNWELLQKMIYDFFDNKLEFVCDEHELVFSSKNIEIGNLEGKYNCEIEPIMCCNQNYSVNQLKLLTKYGPQHQIYSSEKIKVGVFCCYEDESNLKAFIHKIKYGVRSAGNGIVPNFNGFKNVFKKDIEFVFLPNKFSINQLINKDFDSIFSFFMRGLDKFYREMQVDIVLIYFNNKMDFLKSHNSIDFHNKLKLEAANKYLTQFLSQATIESKDNESKILYNLSIAIYTKTIGMPWYPQTYCKGTLFLGMSFGYDSNGIIVGCSQMFDSSGRGMQLVVSQISDKNRKNQFLNYEEAYNLGIRIRTIYYNSNKIESINKIVIHRTTSFKKEEIEGFAKAFEGIDNFVLLQIIEYSKMSCYPFKNGKCKGFPPRRGTIIKDSSTSAYIWTDGSVLENDVLGENITYRNSKRGIAKPIRIVKFYGKTSINEVANEILFLTKMDFNSADVLYSKLPVTIKYSKIVCDIIKQGSFQDKCISFEYIM